MFLECQTCMHYREANEFENINPNPIHKAAEVNFGFLGFSVL